MIRFDNQTRTQMYGALKQAFPEAKVTSEDLVALGICLKRARAQNEPLPPELSCIDLGPYDQQLDALAEDLGVPPDETTTSARAPDDTGRYYWVSSTHVRETPSGFEPFTGELAMSRVTLPQDYPASIQTALGAVLPGDHLVDTVLEANQKYARYLPCPIVRLDLITPPRQGVRFGAISVLLGYESEQSTAPFCYILEAGTATGQPKVLYLGRNMDVTINAYSGYQPTPFACPNHAYTGRLTMNGDDPQLLEITSRKVTNGVSQAPYIQIDASFTKQGSSLKNIWPGFLIARAASIVLLRSMSNRIPEDCQPSQPGARA